jgi:S-adenosylmethionine uptake transporter
MLWQQTHPSLYSILLVCIGYSLFSLSDCLTKWLSEDYSTIQIMATSSLAGLIISAILVVRNKGVSGFRTPHLKLHIIRGICIALIAFFAILSLRLTPLADFYAITFLSPLVVILLSSMIFGEHIGLIRFVAILSGFIGVLIVAGPTFAEMSAGIIYTFITMLMISISILFLRKIGHDYIPLFGFYPCLMIFCICLPFVASSFQVPDLNDAILFLVYSPLLLSAMVITATGYARAPLTSIVAPFHYIQIIWGMLIGYFVFQHLPSLTTITGSLIIVLSGLSVIYYEYRHNKGPRQNA